MHGSQSPNSDWLLALGRAASGRAEVAVASVHKPLPNRQSIQCSRWRHSCENSPAGSPAEPVAPGRVTAVLAQIAEHVFALGVDEEQRAAPMLALLAGFDHAAVSLGPTQFMRESEFEHAASARVMQPGLRPEGRAARRPLCAASQSRPLRQSRSPQTPALSCGHRRSTIARAAARGVGMPGVLDTDPCGTGAAAIRSRPMLPTFRRPRDRYRE